MAEIKLLEEWIERELRETYFIGAGLQMDGRYVLIILQLFLPSVVVNREHT